MQLPAVDAAGSGTPLTPRPGLHILMTVVEKINYQRSGRSRRGQAIFFSVWDDAHRPD